MEGKKRKGIKKLMVILLAVAMTVTFIPGGFAGSDSASAEDTPIKVLEIEGTSNINEVFGFGKSVTPVSINVTKGNPAYDSGGKWQRKKESGYWEDVTTGTFTPGTWRRYSQMYIKGNTYVLDNNTTVKIDGVEWSGDSNGAYINSGYSYYIFYSPEMTIEDTYTKVSEIEATSNMLTVFGNGNAVTKPTFSISKGTEASFSNECWQKKNAQGEWEDATGGNFGEGIWRVAAKVGIDGTYAATHYLDTPTTLKVDGMIWSGGANPTITDTASYDMFYSPELQINTDGTGGVLPTISKQPVSTSYYLDNPAKALSVEARANDGGTLSYQWYENTSESTSDSTLISGATNSSYTPPTSEVGTKYYYCVVTSNTSTAGPSTISDFAKITVKEETRTKVLEVEATSNINEVIGYDKPIASVKFNITKGSPAYVGSGIWQKKDDSGNWKNVIDGNFTEGTWRRKAQVYIGATTHVLDAATTFKVDGQIWDEKGDFYASSISSYVIYYSPELTIGEVEASVENGTADSEKAENNATVTITADAAPTGKMFDKWVVVSGGVELADASKTTTTFVMKYSPVTVKATYKDIPALKSVTTKLSGYRAVRASWTKIAGVTGYKVYYKKSTASSYTYKGSTIGASMNLANLATGTKYYVKVVPYVTESGKTELGPAKVSSGIYTLKKLNAPTVSKKSSGKVTVKWTNINGESGYQISKSTKKTGTAIVATCKTTTGKSKVLTAKKNKTYYYKIRAFKTVNGKKIFAPWSSAKAYKLK